MATLSPTTQQRILDLHAQEHSLGEIVEQTGISLGSVAQVCRRGRVAYWKSPSNRRGAVPYSLASQQRYGKTICRVCRRKVRGALDEHGRCLECQARSWRFEHDLPVLMPE